MPTSPREKVRVMLVESNGPFRVLITDVLRTMGIKEISCVTTPEEALLTAPSHQPNVILLDWQPGERNSLQLVKTIRAGKAGVRRDTPIVMVTPRCAYADVEASRKAGVDEYLIKPISIAGLTARVDEVLFRRREFIESHSFIGPDRRRRATNVDSDRRRRRATPAA